MTTPRLSPTTIAPRLIARAGCWRRRSSASLAPRPRRLVRGPLLAARQCRSPGEHGCHLPPGQTRAQRLRRPPCPCRPAWRR
eukprot:914650-Alexandrium_andersonii.AAC.1